ncbi:MAG: (2Fe-2S)-binding protein [Desulfobacterales bacterium]|nr:(2Fe-2S)-binding protein [Desulfobacterales bacterium]
MKKQTLNLNINGEDFELRIFPNELLVNVVRETVGLTGTKYACGTGQCGACTVLVDDEPVLGCMTLAVSAAGSKITTIEGIAEPDGKLDPLQDAFLKTNAIQCGFCTPGMILVGKDLLKKNTNPTENEIRHHIKGNLCRCTGYNGIVRAIKKCRDDMAERNL